MWGNGSVTLARQEIGYGGERELISAVAAGSRAPRLDALSPADRGKFVLDYLARVRPATKGRLEMVMTHSWAEQSCIWGVRHNCTPGQVSRFRDTIWFRMSACISPASTRGAWKSAWNQRWSRANGPR